VPLPLPVALVQAGAEPQSMTCVQEGQNPPQEPELHVRVVPDPAKPALQE